MTSSSNRLRSSTLSTASLPESEPLSDLFSEKLQLSEKLINRFVKKTVANVDQNGIAKEKGRKNKTIANAQKATEHARQRDLESEHQVVNENFNLFQIGTKSDEPVTKSSRLSKILRLLPEFASLHTKVEASEGTINMAHANLGDERCIIFSNALNDSTENPDAKNTTNELLEDEVSEVFSLSLCDNRISDSGMQVIMRNLTSAKRLYNLRHLDLSDNKIGKDGAHALAKCVCQLSELQRLNISNMNICDGALHDMFCLLSSSDSNDMDLNTKSKCDDDEKPFLRSLKLSKNQLSTLGAKALANYLSSSTGSELLELDISWNTLGIEGASWLWRVLTSHKYLIALDVSWNSLGDHNHEEMAEKVHKPTEVNPLTTAVDSRDVGDTTGCVVNLKGESGDKPPADVVVFSILGQFKKKETKIKYASATALGNLLKKNDTLLHLNIAHNSLCAKECEIIGAGLQDNHVLMGLHITGNSGRVDSHGYMIADTTSWPLEASHYAEPIINDISSKEYHNSIRSQSPNSKMNYYDRNSCSNRNSCWMCGGWTEVEFAYRLTEDDVKKLNDLIAFNQNNYTVQRRDKISDLFPVHLFTSFDNWHPERMRLPSPAEVKVQFQAARTHCTLQNRKQTPASAALKSKNSYKQGKSKPVRAPKKPPQPKPSRGNSVRRRSSVPSTSMEALDSDIRNSTPVEEIEQAEKINLRKASIASYTAEQQQKLGMVLDAFPNQTSSAFSSPSSKNKPIIGRQLSISEHEVTNQLLAVVQGKENDNDEEKEKKENILLYDEAEETNETPMASRNRKTVNMIRPLSTQPSGEGHDVPGKVESDNEGTTSRPRIRENRSVADASKLKNRHITVEDEMGLIFRLRRMVPPGRHSYVFAVGLDFENEEGANTVIDSYQPHNLTSSALTPENVAFARSQGVSLPKRVNTIYIFKNDLIFGNNNIHGQKALPTALVLASKLSHPVNPKPRSRFMPTLGNRKKLWNRMDSVLYKQWTNHQKKYILECFHTDWKQSSIYTLLMGVNGDEHERHEIMNALKEHYALLKDVYDYYWATFSADATGLSGFGYNELAKQCQVMGPATDQLGLGHLSLFTVTRVVATTVTGSKDTTAAGTGTGRRRRSSFPPKGGAAAAAAVQNSENKGSVESKEGNAFGDVESSGPQISIAAGARKVVAMSPRGTKAIMAPRSSAMMKQITLHRSIRERVTEESSSSDDDDEEEGDTFGEDSQMASERAMERRLSTIELQTNPNEIKPKRKQSIVGGKVMEADDLPWKSGNPDGSCTLQDTDMIFISNCMTGQQKEINGKRNLLRFQFLDCIVALACIKYLNSGICKSISLAVDMFIGNNIGRFASRRNDERFLSLILPSKPIDMLLKSHLASLKQAFNKISVPSLFNSNVRTINLSTWLRLCDLSDLNMGERIYKQCYIFSKMQGITDIFSLTYHPKELLLIEFIEAVTRIAYTKQIFAVETGMRKAAGTLSADELNMHVTVATVCQVLKETLKAFIKNATKVQD